MTAMPWRWWQSLVACHTSAAEGGRHRLLGQHPNTLRGNLYWLEPTARGKEREAFLKTKKTISIKCRKTILDIRIWYISICTWFLLHYNISFLSLFCLNTILLKHPLPYIISKENLQVKLKCSVTSEQAILDPVLFKEKGLVVKEHLGNTDHNMEYYIMIRFNLKSEH